MNVGNITTLGSKGQVVIPADYRRALQITPGSPISINLVGQSVYIHSVRVFQSAAEDNSAYLEVLKRVRGSWGPETPEEKRLEKKRRKLELAATKRSRNAW